MRDCWKVKNAKPPSTHTVQAYIGALLESYFFYEIKRFDIKGKEYLRTLGKYYIVDIGLRNYLLGFRNRNSGHAIENVVYFELLRRGYDMAIGKIGNQEVDSIATTADNKLYIQVTESMQSGTSANGNLPHCIRSGIIMSKSCSPWNRVWTLPMMVSSP